MKNSSTWILLCLVRMMTLSCSDGRDTADGSEKGVSIILPDTENGVAAQMLEKRDFHHELVSNSKINARGKTDLCFETGEVIAHIYVKNGDRMQRRRKPADLNRFRLEQKLSQSEDALLKAELELKDILIRQGYSPDDSSKVPAETMKIVRIKSGYEQLEPRYELAKRDMEYTTLIALFDGVVAGSLSKPYNPANISGAFCTTIDSKGMEVDFMMLENELAFIRVGDKAVITSYAGGDTFEGNVSEMNPLVDANGTMKVGALVNVGGRLFSRMDVRVNVRHSLEGRLIVSKSVVVLRSGKQVVLTLKDDRAMWNYVNTGLKNATECVVSDKSQEDIEDGLLEGDTAIVIGSLNLARGVEVYAK